MDSGNDPNQQQRYCPTPIMAPPSVAASPPIMSGSNVMSTMHQPTHHPPPSISPHPGGYYGHHTAGTSHYPTPSPTPPPPPMHHQQYYAHAHSYYAHGSHQQAQQQQTQQSQHHIANAHVPINTPPGSAQPASQHAHLMGHGSYHHPQSQAHHQQWAPPPTHPHQQQSHHYYHQPTHHSPQQQTQQHGYPPPSHSPYSYVQPHAPAPTPPPPPHTSHAQQQQHLQPTQPQQHHPPPQVSVSPGAGQMHQQTPPPHQQPQSHALMNLSRFVSQQSPSPSPRASPNLAASHHPQQQMSQMGPTSPTHFSGHLEHHSTMNGHTSNTGANNSPVMSPPPAPVPNQQPMSPTSPVSQQQHPLILPPQQIPHNINGSDQSERLSPANSNSNAMGSSDEYENSSSRLTMSVNSTVNPNTSKERELPVVFSNITPSKIAGIMGFMKNSNPPTTSVSISKSTNCNSISQNNALKVSDMDISLNESGYSGISSNDAPVPVVDGLGAPDSSDSTIMSSGEQRASCSPSKPIGSPSNSGNGHQMMPVRLQNMHKGARTKANMKKLMQEQQITTPNGQVTDIHSDLPVNARDPEVSSPAKQTIEKPTKPSRKKKSQAKDSIPSVASNDTLMPMSPINMDLSGPGDSPVVSIVAPVVRPGYTKSGKKIGRPRKDVAQSVQQQTTAKKPKKKRESKSTPKKTKNNPQLESEAAAVEVLAPEGPEFDLHAVAENQVQTLPVVYPNTKRKTVKASRKRSSKFSSDTSVVQDLSELEAVSDLINTPQLIDEQLNSAEVSMNESVLSKKGGKRRSKKHVANNSYSSDSTPDSSVLNTIPGSKISEREAESVALNVKQPTIQTTAKGKRKGKKSAPVTTDPPEVVTNTRQTKSGGAKRKAAADAMFGTKEVVVSPERGELPRLRSRSPKQRESPPLRISSPRAAKERSSTPATGASQASTSRSRASREKEAGTASTVTTPLSSPSLSLRSPKKSPEKDKIGIRTSSRQKAIEALNLDTVDAQKEPSPPLAKRSRQISKESLDSTETPVKKGRRKPLINELRLSSDSDRSPPFSNKRASRRKSGSVTGSTDNLSSPSFNPTSSSLSLIPSDGSLEMPSDISNTTYLDNTAPMDQQTPLAVIPTTTVPSTSKRRKPKKIGRTKSRSSRTSLEYVSGTLPEPEYDFTESAPVDNHQIAPITSSLPSPLEVEEVTGNVIVPAPVKARKARKSSGKKGKRRTSTAAAAVVPHVESESQEESTAVVHVAPVKALAVKSKSRKGAGKGKRQKTPPNSTGVLSISIPGVINVTKKNVQFKAARKTRKQSKKSATTKAEEQSEISVPSNTSIDYMMSTTAETPRENSGESQLQELSPSKRRRSSLASATNTQVSAKLNTQNETETRQKFSQSSSSAASGMSPPSKALRRDSRSVSRDYDVSVVLTDIAQTLTAEDTSLLGISTSLSRLQSPPTTFTPVQAMHAMPEQSMSPSKVKEDVYEKVNVPDTFVSQSPKKGKRQAKVKSEGEQQPSKKKLKGALQNQELQERKAILEAEVALVLLDLKTGSNSKSPSPAKSVSGGDPEVVSKKKSKARKRKLSKSPRRSIDNSTGIQESIPTAPLNSNLHFLSSDILPSPPPPQPSPKVPNRKGTKARRSSAAKRIKLSQSLLSIATDGDVNAASSSGVLPHLTNSFPSNSPLSSPINNTTIIPTVPSLEISNGSSVITTTKRKSKVDKKKTSTKREKMLNKLIVCSPDITAVPTAPLMLKITSPKQKRKSSKKETHTATLESSNQGLLERSINEEGSTSQANTTESLPSTEGPVKKKRQRKAKTLNVAVDSSLEVAVPSTSAAALAAQLPSTSKLFPYQISPKPYKKPTVFSKSSTIPDAAKDDDNQKKKTQDAPSLKVVGGRTKFFRGGELEEVDPDPKLPKEKAQLQTDNAVPWICSFCHLGPHAQKLGDLFGPYFANLPSIYGQPSPKRETWMHGDCALWAGRLLLIGSYLRRLEETLVAADQEECTVCGRNGATIGCLRRGCKEGVHYPCAVRKFWKMDEQNFHSYCPKHIPS